MKSRVGRIGIYLIRNKLNNKVYVGQSINLVRRWREHKSSLRKGKHRCSHLQNSWNKYGEDNFEFLIVEELDNINYEKEVVKEKLKKLEEKYMKKYKCGRDTHSYNEFNPLRSPVGGTWPKGEKVKCIKPVLQYDLYGNFINEWKCGIRQVAVELGISDSSISFCCRSKGYKQVGGFQWKYKTENYPKKIPPLDEYASITKFTKDMEKIKEYKDVFEILKELDIHEKDKRYYLYKSNILRCCRGKITHFLNYCWQMEKNETGKKINELRQKLIKQLREKRMEQKKKDTILSMKFLHLARKMIRKVKKESKVGVIYIYDINKKLVLKA